MAGTKSSGNWSKLEKGVAEVNYRLCDALLHKYLLDESVPLSEKISKIIPILTKRVPQAVNVGGQKDNPLEQKVTITWMK